MKVAKYVIGFLCLVMLTTACAQKTQSNPPTLSIVNQTINSPSLKGNLLGDSTEQNIVIYLPPSYSQGNKKYPVIYFLHGFNGSPSGLEQLKQDIGQAMAVGRSEFIIVGVNGRNRLGGSFWANSPATGNWEDFVVQDVITYIDSNYRTKVESEFRGIAGFSMGGFAALNIALKHPDKFSAVYAICPGLLAPGGLKEAMPLWNYGFNNAYGATFSAVPEQQYPHAAIPTFDGSEQDKKIQQDWENGFGNLEQKIKKYQQAEKSLKGIYLEYGTNDLYTWIPKGVMYFSELLTKNNIQHELSSFPGGHTLPNSSVINNMIPFFQKQLKVE